jgi:hypothetical protein
VRQTIKVIATELRTVLAHQLISLGLSIAPSDYAAKLAQAILPVLKEEVERAEEIFNRQ